MLAKELRRGTWQHDPVMLGTNTDPYQRAEGRYRLMPEIIVALTDSGTPFSILTKGTLLRRDLPLLQDAAASVRVSLAMSIAVFDDALQHSVEPGTPSATARLETVRAATEAGFRVTVFLMPILPHLTDSIAAIDDALTRIKDAGAVRVVFGALHLRPGAKQWFMQWLGREHPELVSSYLGLYPGAAAMAPKAYRSWLTKRVRPLLRVHGLDGHAEDDDDRPRSAVPARRAVAGGTTSRGARARRGAPPCSSDAVAPRTGATVPKLGLSTTRLGIGMPRSARRITDSAPSAQLSVATRCERNAPTPERDRRVSDLRLLGRDLRVRRHATGELVDQVVAEADLVERRVDLGALEHLGHLATTLTRDERHDGARATGAAGAAGAVQVGLVLVRRVGLDHQIDVVDVDAAGCDIRRHEHVDATARELLEVARALGLVEVAVQSEGGDAGIVELLGEHLGVRAGAGEDEGLAVAVDEAVEDLGLLAVLDHEDAVIDRARVLVLTGDLVDGRLDEELVDQRRDLAVERGREEELLAAVSGVAEDPLHRLEEAELAHVVGLVDHGDA